MNSGASLTTESDDGAIIDARRDFDCQSFGRTSPLHADFMLSADRCQVEGNFNLQTFRFPFLRTGLRTLGTTKRTAEQVSQIDASSAEQILEVNRATTTASGLIVTSAATALVGRQRVGHGETGEGLCGEGRLQAARGHRGAVRRLRRPRRDG